MFTRWRVVGLGCAALLLAAPPARGQADADFVVIRDWTPVGEVDFRAVADTLQLTAGTIHSSDAYRDIVFRFDYRLPSPQARAEVLVRAHDGPDGTPREYTVALDGVGSSGQLSATGVPLVETRFRPRAGGGRAWTPCEIRVAFGTLTVSVDGAIISQADRLDGTDGRLGFRVAREGIELRGMRVAAPVDTRPTSAATPTFRPDLPDSSAAGIVKPTIRKSARPDYPKELQRRGISGTVRFDIEVTADGHVGDLQPATWSHQDLIPPAMACIRKWRFRPATRDGVPIAATATVEVAFTLER